VNEEPGQQCTLTEPANLPIVLERVAIEFLDVDDHRTIVIYQQAILRVIATEGKATAARAFDIECWKEPPTESTCDSDEFLTASIEELTRTTDTARAESQILSVE